jgi:large subunit ribosomal protein L2
MKQYPPITPGRRQYQTVDYSILTKTEPYKRLLTRLKKHSGRNSSGKITVRHIGGGARKIGRDIEFDTKHLNKTGIVETIEYDPNRSAFISLVLWENGDRSYILAPNGIIVGQKIVWADSAPISIGNRMRLKSIPVGTIVHNVELKPGEGGKIARSAGSWAEVMAHEDPYTLLRLPSGEIRKVFSEGFASIGQVSNVEHHLVSIGKAGRTRGMGIRPTVRGSAMNPRDHPYGGGEGRALRGTRKPKTKWGKITGGRKTRKKKKWSNALIVQRRKENK